MDKFVKLFEENVDVSALLDAVTVTWQGMGAIFIVMAVIAGIVFAAARFASKK